MRSLHKPAPRIGWHTSAFVSTFHTASDGHRDRYTGRGDCICDALGRTPGATRTFDLPRLES